jgi:hypothetical protein
MEKVPSYAVRFKETRELTMNTFHKTRALLGAVLALLTASTAMAQNQSNVTAACDRACLTRVVDWEARWADTRIHGTTKRQVAAMFAEEKPFLLALPIEPFRYYASSTWMAALKSMPLITAYRLARRRGLERRLTSSGTGFISALSIPRPTSFSANMSVKSEAAIVFMTAIVRRKLPSLPSNCWREPLAREPLSVRSARPSIAVKAKSASAESWVCSP